MRRLRWVVAALGMAVIGLNLVACFHARAMTRWSGDVRTPGPEKLAWTQRAGVLLMGVSIPRPADTRTPGALGLPFEVLRFPNGEGETLEAWLIPSDSSRVTFLLFHGYGASKESLLPLAQALHELDYPTILVDFHGSGGSSGRDTTLGVKEALDVAAAVRYHRERWPAGPIVLYGQSMGGASVLRAVARHGVKAEGLVVEATFDRLLTTVKNRFRAMDLPPVPLAHLIVFWGGLLSGIDGFDINPMEDAARVSCPTLVFHGSRDLRVSREEAESVYANLQSWKRFTEFDSAGHGLVVLSDQVRWEHEINLLAAELLTEEAGPPSGSPSPSRP